MAREGTPRVRHKKHRAFTRLKRQPIITNFLTERAASLLAYADEEAVWDQLSIDKAETIAAQT